MVALYGAGSRPAALLSRVEQIFLQAHCRCPDPQGAGNARRPSGLAKWISASACCATAMSLGATVDRVANRTWRTPPYSEALDNVITAANVLRNILDGVTQKVSAADVKAP